MRTKRSTECAVPIGLGACHGCDSGRNLALHVDFHPQIHRVRIFCGAQDLYEKLELLLRTTIRRCLEDDRFNDSFKDDIAVKKRWKV